MNIDINKFYTEFKYIFNSIKNYEEYYLTNITNIMFDDDLKPEKINLKLIKLD